MSAHDSLQRPELLPRVVNGAADHVVKERPDETHSSTESVHARVYFDVRPGPGTMFLV